jgi:DNA repair exonuclease SbcCD ATPase subunit
MKTIFLISGLLAIVALVCSCSSNSDSTSVASVSESTEANVSPQFASLTADIYSNGLTKLIKTANYRIQVENVQRSVEAIELSIRKFQGFVTSSNMRLYDRSLESKLTIRVQTENFQDLLKEIDKQALYVNFRDIKTEDVSKQFVDLESRLKTKREVEQRYMEILRTKAGTIEELLNAEKQIGALQEEIEATISRISFLKDEVRYSTIELEVYQTVAQDRFAGNNDAVGENMIEAVVQGWGGLLTVITGLLYLWPWILIGTATSLFFLAKRRRRMAV